MKNIIDKLKNIAAETPGTPTPKLTRKQVAGIFNVHTETVKRWDHAGDLKAIRINSRTVRYDPADVQRLIDQARGQGGVA